jgi:DNA polymerase-1
VLECPESELEKTASVVKDVMESAYQIDVPLKTDARFGTNWGDLKPL